MKRPFWWGVGLGVLLPSLVAGVLFVAGRFEDYMVASRGYALLPWFVPLGFAASALGWALYPRFTTPRAGSAFALGLLVGGTAAGTLLLWASSGERSFVNRLVFSVFGGPLVCGFWVWIGGILGYAAKQQRATRTVSQA